VETSTTQPAQTTDAATQAGTQAAARGLRLRLRRSPWAVAGVVLVFYAIWIGAYLFAGHDIRDFIVIGRHFVTKSHASAVIRYDPTYRYEPTNQLGYDGQYSYYIALDPVNAHYYMDWPAYRYTRILYPMLTRVLSLGQPAIIPYVLVLINWLAMGGGTLAVAAWLKRRGVSPWLALIYGCYTGPFIAVQGDLTEPLAYGLVALAIYLFDFGGKRRVLWAAVCFGLAALTRESTAVFAAAYAGALLVNGSAARGASVPARIISERARAALDWARERLAANWRPAALLLGVAVLPYLAFKGFLTLWLHDTGVPAQVQLEWIPFAGILAHWPWEGHRLLEVDSIVLPGLICLGMGLWALRRRLLTVELVALLANIVLFVALLPAASYTDLFASARITTGVVLGALYCVPLFDRLTRGKRTWLVAVGLLWLMFVPLQMVELITHHA
jgi:hypothetical protein